MRTLEPGRYNTTGGLIGMGVGLVTATGGRGETVTANAIGCGIFGYLLGSLLEADSDGPTDKAKNPTRRYSCGLRQDLMPVTPSDERFVEKMRREGKMVALPDHWYRWR